MAIRTTLVPGPASQVGFYIEHCIGYARPKQEISSLILGSEKRSVYDPVIRTASLDRPRDPGEEPSWSGDREREGVIHRPFGLDKSNSCCERRAGKVPFEDRVGGGNNITRSVPPAFIRHSGYPNS